MNDATEADIQALGRAAAEEVAGEDAVEDVDVQGGVDVEGRPAYHFSFLIDQRRARLRPGLILTRVGQKLVDDLALRDDVHRPTIRILNREDWDRRAHARSG